MKFKLTTSLLAFTALTTPAFAQVAPAAAEDEASNASDAIIVTGSSIKRKAEDSAVPLQIYSNVDLQREGVSNPEQFISLLNSNGNGADNLSSNADITSGAQRGTNGVSSANLRGQGSGATLVLLNGRRVASHGLGGGAVDVNQIPFAAVDRIEVLKDGASAIYGTDAIGGVINFVLKKNFKGVSASTFVDATEQGGGNIYKGSLTAGIGDLEKDGINLMVAGSYSLNKILRGTQRDFVTTNAPNRGLSADTRGTPFATIFAVGTTGLNPTNTLLTAGNAPFVPGSTTVRGTAVNPLDIPGGAGCSSVAGMFAYDEVLWGGPANAYACAYETGKPAVLTQPLETYSFLARGVGRIGEHELSLEYISSNATANKSFSENQLSNNGGTLQLRYPRTTANAAIYDRIVGQLQTAFPGIVLNVGNPIAYRWRCIECGPRTITTKTKTNRITFGIEGPLFADWEYRAGASSATSTSVSRLGRGYFFRGTNLSTGPNGVLGAADNRAPTAVGATAPGIVGLLNSGLVNIFLRPGETQSAAALAGFKAISAEGTQLYGGKFKLTQIDGSATGSLFELPGGTVKAAIGFDYRKEEYSFDGDARAVASRPDIFNAPFDEAFALTSRSRDVKAVYGELLLPVFDGFELNAAIRTDEYSGFGRTTNPKVSFRYEPIDFIAFRGSYSTGFRVPSFNQIFNGTQISPLPGADLADPQSCPGGRPNQLTPGCAIINPDVLSGGNLNVGPEESKQFGLGVVFQPTRNISATVDWWKIDRKGTISTLSVRELVDNFSIFGDRFIRNSAGTLIQIDQRVINAGASFTQGIDVALRANTEALGGAFGFGLDGTYLLVKKSQLIPSAPVSASEIGKFTFSGDLGLRWKHSAYLTYANGDFGVSLSQIFRLGYKNNAIGQIGAGTLTRPDYNERVKDYITYNMTISYTGIEHIKLTAGVKNIFNTDPPFAITYDTDTGAGSSWEPRVADPRGRAFTFLAEFNF
jgi:iron complex outermembrane recepter protein